MRHVTTPTGNRLLDQLKQDEFAVLAPALQLISLSMKQVIEAPNVPITAIVFPVTGVLSVVASATQNQQVEVGLIGHEGMSGTSVVLGNGQSPNDTYVQIEGSAYVFPANDLRQAIQQSLALHNTLLHYVQSFLTQATHTALANGRAKIEERLARWLLMAQDRIGRPDLPLTHELISIMLGVRRPGVTEALNSMEGLGLIKATRGVLRVIDRAGIEACANGWYGVPEAEYERLMGSCR